MDKNGKYWGFYGAERSDQRHNTNAGKEIILLKYTSTMTPTAHIKFWNRNKLSAIFSTIFESRLLKTIFSL